MIRRKELISIIDDIDNLERRIRDVNSTLLSFKDNYVHKTTIWDMRSKITGDIALQFGGEISRLEAVMNTLLEELTIKDEEQPVCKTCGQPLPEKDCC